MSKWAKICLGVVALLTFFVTSCNNDDEPSQPAPSMTLSAPQLSDGTYIANKGGTVSISVSINAPGGFNVLRISYSGISKDPDEVVRTEAGQTSFDYTYTFENIEFDGAPFTITFLAVDDANQSASQEVTVEPEIPAVSFPESENDFIEQDTLVVSALETFRLGVQVSAGAGFFSYEGVLPGTGGEIIFRRERTELPPTQGNQFIDRIEESIPSEYAGQILTFSATVRDEFGQETTENLPVKVLEASTALFTGIVLEAPIGDNPGERTSKTFFAGSTGLTYSSDEIVNATENLSAIIDFGYFFGDASQKASLSSPNTFPLTIYNLGPNGQNWQTLNVTSFKETIFTPENFDNELTSVEDLIEVFGSGGGSTIIPNIAVDQIISFKTSNDKYGLIKVVRVVDGTGANGEVELDIRVTQ